MTKAQFWEQMAQRFAAVRDPTLSAQRNPDGTWVLIGGTPESQRQFKELASIAGRAAQGHFPADVE